MPKHCKIYEVNSVSMVRAFLIFIGKMSSSMANLVSNCSNAELKKSSRSLTSRKKKCANLFKAKIRKKNNQMVKENQESLLRIFLQKSQERNNQVIF